MIEAVFFVSRLLVAFCGGFSNFSIDTIGGTKVLRVK